MLVITKTLQKQNTMLNKNIQLTKYHLIAYTLGHDCKYHQGCKNLNQDNKYIMYCHNAYLRLFK